MDDALLTGCSCDALSDIGDGLLLLPDAAQAFRLLVRDAKSAGFDLRGASAHRSFDRQLLIFNGKASGERPLHDDAGRQVDVSALAMDERIEAILRFSALPGGSRHHWGTEVDVYDASTLPGDYRVALSPEEVAPGGLFDALHCWLDESIAAGRSHGFYRPYDRDRGGVAPERWHLSYAPLAACFQPLVNAQLLRRCWEQPRAQSLCWRTELEQRLPELVERYLQNVSPAPVEIASRR